MKYQSPTRELRVGDIFTITIYHVSSAFLQIHSLVLQIISDTIKISL